MILPVFRIKRWRKYTGRQPSLSTILLPKLGFNVLYQGGDGHGHNFWAIVGRDQIMLMFKHITPEVHPQPNPSRHEWAAWDAYIFTNDPDSLYTEFLASNVPIHRKLANTGDGLRAFEITDNSGYVLCFGRPSV